jgi:hypothetical protein
MLIIAQLIKKFPGEGSLPDSEEPVIGPYPESDESTPHHHTLFL